MNSQVDKPGSVRLAAFLAQPTGRLLSLGFLVLLLLIPLAMINDRVQERGHRRDQVASEIAASWGGEQVLSGPILRLPYVHHWQQIKSGQTIERETRGWLYLSPDSLDVDADIRSSRLRRSLFEVPVYRAALKLRGRFVLPERSDLPLHPDAQLQFGRAELMLGLSEPGAVEAQSRVTLAGHEADWRPSAQALGAEGIHAVFAKGLDAAALREGLSFEVALRIKGSDRFSLSPVARETLLAIRSDWPHPGFFGSGLPAKREISDNGFEAAWSVSELGRGYPGLWADAGTSLAQMQDSAFGVALVSPVDPYTMAARVAKYGALLLLLSFALVWVMELLGGTPMHLIQYLLLGSSLCLFGLLQLAIAEHLGFQAAFVIAAMLVVLQAAGYVYLAQASRARALGMAALLSVWFAYLYVVLRSEDAAFLLGASALFAALTGIMWVTRKVNWFSTQQWEVASAQLDS